MIKKIALVLMFTFASVNSVFAQATQEELISPETGVDYSRLRDLLLEKKWQQANEETLNVLLQSANRNQQGWLDSQSIQQLACWDLKTIDQLWTESSGDRFGFSVQLPIFLKAGNRPGKLSDEQAYVKFGEAVGWREDGDWIAFKGNLKYNLDAPKGHLPYPRGEYDITGGRLEYINLSQRMVDCQLVDKSLLPPTQPKPIESDTESPLEL